MPTLANGLIVSLTTRHRLLPALSGVYPPLALTPGANLSVCPAVPARVAVIARQHWVPVAPVYLGKGYPIVKEPWRAACFALRQCRCHDSNVSHTYLSRQHKSKHIFQFKGKPLFQYAQKSPLDGGLG